MVKWEEEQELESDEELMMCADMAVGGRPVANPLCRLYVVTAVG